MRGERVREEIRRGRKEREKKSPPPLVMHARVRVSKGESERRTFSRQKIFRRENGISHVRERERDSGKRGREEERKKRGESRERGEELLSRRK